MSIPRIVLAVFVAVALSGCSGDRSPSVLSDVGQIFLSALSGSAATPQPRDVLTREIIDNSATPLLLVESEARGASGTMLVAGRNGPHTSWMGADGAGLTLRYPGIVTATRGIGGDLLSADVEGVVAALRTGGDATFVRTMRFIDGNDRDYARSMSCRYHDNGPRVITVFEEDHRTRLVTETCRMSDRSFENRYWVGQDGFVWRSLQFVGSDIGHLTIERLYR